MYCELLADAVKRLKNEPVEAIPTAVIDLGFTTYIPKNYIPSDRHRMDVYRKIAVARGGDDLKEIAGELADVYGPVPDEVELLLELAELRIAASKRDIKSIVTSGQDLIFSFAKDAGVPADSLFKKVSGKVRIPDPKTVYLRLEKNYFVLGTPYGEPKTLITVLGKILEEKKK
jgi:transcription-repair coupling factor (superfamily II helicase)